jgi:hypothetical protein
VNVSIYIYTIVPRYDLGEELPARLSGPGHLQSFLKNDNAQPGQVATNAMRSPYASLHAKASKMFRTRLRRFTPMLDLIHLSYCGHTARLRVFPEVGAPRPPLLPDRGERHNQSFPSHNRFCISRFNVLRRGRKSVQPTHKASYTHTQIPTPEGPLPIGRTLSPDE